MAIRVRREASRSAKHRGFPYQVEAVEALRHLDYGAVFHEQGLGKTKIAIDLALQWLRDGTVDSVLFVTKKALVANWRDEIRAHSFLSARTLSQDRSANFFAFNSPARFYLTNYEVCISEQKRLRLFLKTRKVGVICDEAQKFKNPDSRIAKALFALRTGFARRVILTGTPVANRPEDLWSLVFFLDGGGALGERFLDFRRDVDLSNDLLSDEERRLLFESTLSRIFGKIASFAIRETKASAGIKLPSKSIENILVDAEDRQSEIYRSYRDDLRAIVVRDGVPTLDRADEIMKRLLRLVQIASNPRLVDHSYFAEPGKMEVLRSLLHSALSEDSSTKAIVWTSFTDGADFIARELRNYQAVRVHGKLSIADRNRAIGRFKSDAGVRVLVATPGAAKEGLTLTVANTAIFFDRSFSLDDYLQAQDRIHRISQERECFIFNLIMRNTVDEWVDDLLAAKHLAAQLSLGDIELSEYRKKADYNFGETLSRILAAGPKAGDSRDSE